MRNPSDWRHERRAWARDGCWLRLPAALRQQCACRRPGCCTEPPARGIGGRRPVRWRLGLGRWRAGRRRSGRRRRRGAARGGAALGALAGAPCLVVAAGATAVEAKGGEGVAGAVVAAAAAGLAGEMADAAAAARVMAAAALGLAAVIAAVMAVVMAAVMAAPQAEVMDGAAQLVSRSVLGVLLPFAASGIIIPGSPFLEPPGAPSRKAVNSRIASAPCAQRSLSAALRALISHLAACKRSPAPRRMASRSTLGSARRQPPRSSRRRPLPGSPASQSV
jgi:hypothetical protein